MKNQIVALVWICVSVLAQDAAIPVIPVDVPPIGPVDVNAVYASPRDAARHRLQSTLSALESKRDIRAGIRGLAQAVIVDRTYAPAVFDLAVLCAIASQWDDAIPALKEAARLDPSRFGPIASDQLVRWQILESRHRTEEGRRRLNYDLALGPALDRMKKANTAESLRVLAEVGRIDPNRWEAPALIAKLHAETGAFSQSVQFLQIAHANAAPPVKESLRKALAVMEREVRYLQLRQQAETAADNGEHAKAAALFENAWSVVPARFENGVEAASALLLANDTAKAAVVLARLVAGRDERTGKAAGSMLKELAAIESTAGQAGAADTAFFHDAGFAEPPMLDGMLPEIDRKPLEILARPLPSLIRDEEAVTLLASLSAAPAEAAQAFLPALPEPGVAGEQPWREVLVMTSKRIEAAASDVQTESASIAEGRVQKTIVVRTEPARALVFANGRSDPSCRTPCDLMVDAGTHEIAVNLPGYLNENRTIKIAGKTAEASFILEAARGNVLVETAAGSAIKVNGVAVPSPGPAELVLLPGVHRIEVASPQGPRERLLNVKPGSRLRIVL